MRANEVVASVVHIAIVVETITAQLLPSVIFLPAPQNQTVQKIKSSPYHLTRAIILTLSSPAMQLLKARLFEKIKSRPYTLEFDMRLKMDDTL